MKKEMAAERAEIERIQAEQEATAKAQADREATANAIQDARDKEIADREAAIVAKEKG